MDGSLMGELMWLLINIWSKLHHVLLMRLQFSLGGVFPRDWKNKSRSQICVMYREHIHSAAIICYRLYTVCFAFIMCICIVFFFVTILPTASSGTNWVAWCSGMRHSSSATFSYLWHPRLHRQVNYFYLYLLTLLTLLTLLLRSCWLALGILSLITSDKDDFYFLW